MTDTIKEVWELMLRKFIVAFARSVRRLDRLYPSSISRMDVPEFRY